MRGVEWCKEKRRTRVLERRKQSYGSEMNISGAADIDMLKVLHSIQSEGGSWRELHSASVHGLILAVCQSLNISSGSALSLTDSPTFFSFKDLPDAWGRPVTSQRIRILVGIWEDTARKCVSDSVCRVLRTYVRTSVFAYACVERCVHDFVCTCV